MQKLVSIIIPAYNCQQWISQSIESALAQTWPNKEIIVVDDGSTDNTLSIAKRYESKSLKVVHQENRGAAAARNTGLKLAQGDYIQYLDADDLLAPDKIEYQIRLSEEESNVVLFSSSFGIFYVSPKRAKFKPTSLWRDLPPSDWLCTKFKENLWMNPAVWLVSRELTDLAGPWDERLSLDDDGEYFCRMIRFSKKIKFVERAKVFYRQWDPGSLSRLKSDRACNSLLLSLKLCTKYLLDLEDSERTRRACSQLIQTWASYFYGKEKLWAEACNLVAEFGGDLSRPKLSWKYVPIKWAFGFRTARKIQSIVKANKLRTKLLVEKVL